MYALLSDSSVSCTSSLGVSKHCSSSAIMKTFVQSDGLGCPVLTSYRRSGYCTPKGHTRHGYPPTRQVDLDLGSFIFRNLLCGGHCYSLSFYRTKERKRSDVSERTVIEGNSLGTVFDFLYHPTLTWKTTPPLYLVSFSPRLLSKL